MSENVSIDALKELSGVKYQRLLYGEWLTDDLTEQEQRLEAWAKEYHDRCDAYDVGVCTATSPRTGEPIPANGEEQGKINQHSYQVRRDILAHSGLTEKELHVAIAGYGRKYRR